MVRCCKSAIMFTIIVAAGSPRQEASARAPDDPVLCAPSDHREASFQREYAELGELLAGGDFEGLDGRFGEIRRRPLPRGSYRPDWERFATGLARAGLDQLDAWVAARPTSGAALLVRGLARIHWAWQARGTGWGHTVSDEAARLMRRRLEEARSDLVRAADLDPKGALAPAALITVAMGLGADRAEAMSHFERATQADPTSAAPYERMVTYLLPKWHGSRDGRDVQEFALVLAARRATKAPVAWVAVPATFRQLCEHLGRAEQTRFLSQPAVRDACVGAFEQLEAAFPEESDLFTARADLCGLIPFDAREVWRIRVRAAELGNFDSQVMCGRILERGLLGVARDAAQAARWYCRAAAQRHVDGMANLGRVYLEGIGGVSVDAARGLQLLEAAREGGSLDALFILGLITLEGRHGVETDPARGEAMVLEAQRRGHLEATGLVGRWYWNQGRRDEALRLIFLACENGDAGAALTWAEIVLAEDKERGPARAAPYLRNAMRDGLEDARRRLVEVLRKHPELRRPGDPE